MNDEGSFRFRTGESEWECALIFKSAVLNTVYKKKKKTVSVADTWNVILIIKSYSEEYNIV